MVSCLNCLILYLELKFNVLDRRNSFGPIGPPTHPGSHRRLTTPSQPMDYNQFRPQLPEHGNGEVDHQLVVYSDVNGNSDIQGNQHR
jgi:hypothetical protein